MCDPMTIASVGLSLAGGAINAAGSLRSGRDQAAGFEDQAMFADRQAVLERQAGAYERDRLRTRNDRLLGDMRHRYISSGIDPSSGSAREVVADSAREAALDEEAVVFGATVRSDNQRHTARLARRNAQSARTGSVFEAAGSMVGAASTSFRTVLSNPYVELGNRLPQSRYGFGISV